MLYTSSPENNDLDPFREDAITDETHALNEMIVQKLSAFPDQWGYAVHDIREMRRQGHGPYDIHPPCEHAFWHEIHGNAGSIRLYCIPPENIESRGVYLHFHSGGWTYGAPDLHDPYLVRIANDTGLTIVSVDYRLAPEHPYPAALEDALKASLWVITKGQERFGSHLVIGGESAGAHIAALTLVRLRDRYDLTPFKAANLIAGIYDLSMTPSARRWGPKKLVINSRDIEMFVRHFLPSYVSNEAPKVSPLYSGTKHMPPAIFTIGTKDPLLDDTLFMAARWEAGGNYTERFIAPGGCHLFQFYDCAIAHESHKRCVDFINGILNDHMHSKPALSEDNQPRVTNDLHTKNAASGAVVAAASTLSESAQNEALAPPQPHPSHLAFHHDEEAQQSPQTNENMQQDIATQAEQDNLSAPFEANDTQAVPAQPQDQDINVQTLQEPRPIPDGVTLPSRMQPPELQQSLSNDDDDETL